MEDEVCGSRSVGCVIGWWNPFTVVRDSNCVPLTVVLSPVPQTEGH